MGVLATLRKPSLHILTSGDVQLGKRQIGDGEGNEYGKDSRKNQAHVEPHAQKKDNDHQTETKQRILEKVHQTSLANFGSRNNVLPSSFLRKPR